MTTSAMIEQIQERLRNLPPDKIAVIFDFVNYIADRVTDQGEFLAGVTGAELLAEDAQWDSTFEAVADKLEALSDAALEDFQAGHTSGVAIVNGELVPAP